MSNLDGDRLHGPYEGLQERSSYYTSPPGAQQTLQSSEASVGANSQIYTFRPPAMQVSAPYPTIPQLMMPQNAWTTASPQALQAPPYHYMPSMSLPPFPSTLPLQSPTPQLSSKNIYHAPRMQVMNTASAPVQTRQHSPLSPEFKRRGRKFWRCGRVIRALWAEPAGSDASTVHGSSAFIRTASREGSFIHSNIRRFVIVRVGHGYSVGLAIFTHGDQGAKKSGIAIEEYGIIHGSETTAPLPEPEESGMKLREVGVRLCLGNNKLRATSRLNYGKPYTIEGNIQVEHIGDLVEQDLAVLEYQYRKVQDRKNR